MSETSNAGQLSPDGNWRWDGTTWQPVSTPPAAPAATDPTTAAPTAPADPTAATPTVAPPAPAAAAPAAPQPPADTTPAAKSGDIVTVRVDDDSPAFTALVVGLVDGSNDDNGRPLRDAGVLVVPLPDATYVPNSALRD